MYGSTPPVTGVSKKRGRGRFSCNAVLGLGLGSGLTLALTLTPNNPNLILTLTLTLKQHSLKKDRPRLRPRVLRALAWYSQPSLNGHLVLVPAVFSHFTVTLHSLKRTPLYSKTDNGRF